MIKLFKGLFSIPKRLGQFAVVRYGLWAGVVALVVIGKIYAPATSKPESTGDIDLKGFSLPAAKLPVQNVERVIDGDTIIADGMRIRLAGIDAPEINQNFGVEAKDFLESLLGAGEVSLLVEGQDKYDRTIAEVFVNNISVCELLLENGYAHVFHTRNAKRNEVYQNLEFSAKTNRLGLWVQPNPLRPYDFRRASEFENQQ